jgi:hypothetical protein
VSNTIINEASGCNPVYNNLEKKNKGVMSKPCYRESTRPRGSKACFSKKEKKIKKG